MGSCLRFTRCFFFGVKQDFKATIKQEVSILNKRLFKEISQVARMVDTMQEGGSKVPGVHVCDLSINLHNHDFELISKATYLKNILYRLVTI